MSWVMRLAIAVCVGVAVAAQAQAETCPHQKGWKPTADDLQQMLAAHSVWVKEWKKTKLSKEWASQHSQGRANLCKARIPRVDLSGADLYGAVLSEAELPSADLRKTALYNAQLDNAIMWNADLTEANLSWADLTDVKLNGSDLTGVWLSDAQLNRANLYRVKGKGANLYRAKLNKAVLTKADLTEADLSEADLIDATLTDTTLTNARLTGAKLNGAVLKGTILTSARLAFTDLTGATYAPASPPPDGYVAGIKGLTTLTFPRGEEAGLVQLRKLLQEAGLRDLEREATYAIERGRTQHALEAAPGEALSATGVAESAFRFLAFDLTTAYGLHPLRALGIILLLWVLLTPIYAWSAWRGRRPLEKLDGIYQVWPDRIEVQGGTLRIAKSHKIERLERDALGAVGWGTYFSLLSAFHIGFREYSVGTWIARMQPHDYTLRAIGWVRVLSGAQSLLSVYLLAIWALTYFGRPFE
jgi:uncharacterized protein YjbI with pentapeptide repeats